MVAVKTNLEWMLYKHSTDYRDPSKGFGVLDLSIYKGPDETVIVVETRLFPPSLGGPVVLLTLVAGATQVSPPNWPDVLSAITWCCSTSIRFVVIVHTSYTLCLLRCLQAGL